MERFLGIAFITIILGLIGTGVVAIAKKIEYEESLVVVSVETRTLTLTYVDYPKHFWVNGIDDSGAVWQYVGRSKHCNGSDDRVFKGQDYPIQVTTYRDPEGKVFSRLNDDALNSLMC